MIQFFIFLLMTTSLYFGGSIGGCEAEKTAPIADPDVNPDEDEEGEAGESTTGGSTTGGGDTSTGGTGNTDGTGTTGGSSSGGTTTGGIPPIGDPVPISSLFTLQSNDIPANGTIGAAFAYPHPLCGGMVTDGRSPELHWSGQPGSTCSIAVSMVDKDADDFVHWLLVDLSGSRQSIETDYQVTPMEGNEGVLGYNDYADSDDPMESGYAGPCPCGNHTYEFTVWAMDACAGIEGEVNLEDAQSVMAGIKSHATTSASFRANFEYTGEGCQ